MKTPLELLIGRLKKIDNNEIAIEIAKKLYMKQRHAIQEAYFAGWSNAHNHITKGVDIQSSFMYYQNKYEKN